MKHEDSFRLMEFMIHMDYPPNLIMLTLNFCAYGQAIGPAFMEAQSIFRENLCKTDTHNQEQCEAT